MRGLCGRVPDAVAGAHRPPRRLPGHRGRFFWSPGTVLLVTGDGSFGHWGRFFWSLGTVLLVTGDGSFGHRGRFLWSLGTVLLVTGRVEDWPQQLFP